MPTHSTFTLDDVHGPISFEYADQAAREGDTSLLSTDLRKLAIQLDDNSIWILTAVTPSWQQIGLGSGDVVVNNIYNTDGTINGLSRTASLTNGGSLSFVGYDTTSADYTVRGEVGIGQQSASILARTGDGAGALTATSTISASAVSGLMVTDGIFSRGITYNADYSSNYTDRSLVDKGYVDSVTGSIYNEDGTLSGNRTVTGENNSLTFNHYNATSSTYTLRSALTMEDDDITITSALGDGFGADVASTSLSMLNTGLEIATGIGDTSIFLDGNDWTFYEGTTTGSTSLITMNGDGDHSLFDPYMTLHEGYATGNGTNSQALVVNYGKGVKVQFNDGTRSSDTHYLRSVLTGADNFDYMEESYQGLRYDLINIDQLNWRFDTTAGTNQWNIYPDDSSSTAIFTLDDNGDLEVGGHIAVGQGEDIRWGVTSFPDDEWVVDAAGGAGDLRFIYDDDGSAGILLYLSSSGVLRYSSDVSSSYVDRSLVDKEYVDTRADSEPIMVVGPDSSFQVTTTEQDITLTSVPIDGATNAYSVLLGANTITFDEADGSEIYEIQYSGRFEVDTADTGVNRSSGWVKAQLNGVDIANSEQPSYIREFQGGSNGKADYGVAHSFLVQPADTDVLTFVVYGTTDTGQTLTNFDLTYFSTIIKRLK